jgi:DNA-binding transcriptional regulator YiaG
VIAETRAKSPILTAMRETASGLRRLGLIDKHKMDRFDALRLTPMTYSAGQIRKLRSIRENCGTRPRLRNGRDPQKVL